MNEARSEVSHGIFHENEEAHENKQGRSSLDPGTDPQALGNDDGHARGSRRRDRLQARSRRPDRGRGRGIRGRGPWPGPGHDPSRRARGGTRNRRTQVREVNVLLDANALLALLLAEPAMERVLSLLREGGIAMTGANLAEVFDVGIRRKGHPPMRMAELVEPLLEGPITSIPL